MESFPCTAPMRVMGWSKFCALDHLIRSDRAAALLEVPVPIFPAQHYKSTALQKHSTDTGKALSKATPIVPCFRKGTTGSKMQLQ